MFGDNKNIDTINREGKAVVNMTHNKHVINFDWSNHPNPIIAYITMGTAQSCQHLKQRFQKLLGSPSDGTNNSYVFICHSYDEDCDDCIFQHGTSYAEGKNIIVKALVNNAATTTKEERLWDRVKYVVSFDDDVPIFPIPFNGGPGDKSKGLFPKPEHLHDGWKPFHDMLLNETTTHPLIKPQYYPDFKDHRTTYQTGVDENFWAIRKDHLPVIYPHSTIGEYVHWANAGRVFYLLYKCYPNGFQVLSNFRTLNPAHAFDTSDYGAIADIIVEQLQEGYSEIGPWKAKMYPLVQHFTAMNAPSLGLHPTCRKVMFDRFQKWIDGEYKP